MSKCVIILDNSNIFIEGQKHSARTKGASITVPTQSDPSWRIRFDQLLKTLAGTREIHAAVLVGSKPPPNDGVWKAAEAGGFQVITYDRDARGKEKCVDTELVAQGTKIICLAKEKMDLVIASGDRDFIPLVKVAQSMEWKVEMAAFNSSFTTGGDMATTVDKIVSLDGLLSQIGSCEFAWP